MVTSNLQPIGGDCLHIITGLVVSTLASRFMGKRTRTAKRNPAVPKQIKVAHALPGRIRLYCWEFRSPRVSEALGQQLRRVDGILSVENGQHTGSLLVKYDPEMIDQKLLVAAIQKLLGPDAPLAKQGAVMDELQLGYDAFNYAILQKTAGAVDVRTLMAGGLFTLAVKELVRTGSLGMPTPITLLYWAFLLSGLSRSDSQ